MPLIGTIIWTVLHFLLALGINYALKETGLIKHGEFLTVYFVILAAKYFDAQLKFSLAYRENPDIVEQILREQLNKDGE